MPRPVFLVNQYGPRRRRSRANDYAPTGGTETWWRAGLIHGYFPGVGMDFFFEDEGSASRFSLWTLYDPSQIIEAATPQDQQYIVTDIWGGWYSIANPFGGRPLSMQVWYVGLRAEHTQQEIELRMPTEADANAFSVNRAYRMTDLVGTLPEIPADISDQLADFADRARFRQQQADLAEQQQRQLEQAAIRTQLEAEAAALYAQTQKQNADAQAAAKAAAAAAAQALYLSLANTRDITSMARAAGIDIDAPASSFADEYDRFYVPMAQVLADSVAKDFGAAAGEAARSQFLSKLTLANTSGLSAGPFSKTPGTPYVTAFRDYLLATGQHFGVPDPLASQAYYITNGGSRGTYDGALFQTGTFPVAGFWFGTYIRT